MNFWPRYHRATLRSDVVAALTVAAISLPQGMAYAVLAGVDPRYGLYSAIVVTAVASVFGSSSHLINGPTSAISLVVFSALSIFEPDQRIEAAEAMFLLGAMVGSIQILIAVFRLGDLTRYISEAVIMGFMAAAAMLLAIGQVGNALGVKDKGTGAQHVLHRLWLTLSSGDAVNFRAVAITLATLALAIAARKLVRRYRLPQFDMLLVLLVVSAAAFLAGWSVPNELGRTAVSVAGAVPRSLPALHIPVVHPVWALDLARDAFAISLLGLLEALAIAKSIATQTGQTLDFNRQCRAEGIANLAGAFFQCLPGSGSLSRSAINFQAGAATRFSGILTAGVVAVSVLLLAPLAAYVPKAALAGLLLLTAARLVDLDRLRFALRASRMDAGVVGVTVFAALAFGLDEAILIGVALSIVLFVPRAARLKSIELFVDAGDVVRERTAADTRHAGFLLYDLEGELFFGAASRLEQVFGEIKERAGKGGEQHVLLRLKRVRHPDVVSLELFGQFLRQANATGLTVWLAGLQPDLLAAFDRLGFAALLPRERMFSQGADEASATLSAIQEIRACLSSGSRKEARQLYYMLQ